MRTRRARQVRPQQQSSANPSALLPLLVVLLLVVPTLLVYCRVLDHAFVNHDDQDTIVDNPHVQSGLTGANVWWALTSLEHANWYPLTWLSLQLDRTLYGGMSPAGFHFTNVVLHLANVVLLFWVLRRLTGALWRSALVAGLFALHPLHVESVAWVSERKDVLSTLMLIGTIWAYAAYVERPGAWRYTLVVVVFALGLMAKPMLVTLPFVLLLLDYWPLGRLTWNGVEWRRRIVEKLPLFGLSLISCVVTVVAQSRGNAVRALETFPFDERLLNACDAYVRYLAKTVWPADLAIHYPHPGATLSPALALAEGTLIVAVTLGVVLAARRMPFLAVGWFWYLGTLVPVIGVVQVGTQAMADRYTYVPLIGVFIAFAWGSAGLATSVGRRGFTAGLSVAAVVILMACIAVTWRQLGYWRDSWTLWEHAVQVTRNNAHAYDTLGMLAVRANDWPQARQLFARAIELNPADARARMNLGRASLTLGDLEQAKQQLTAALELDPNRLDAHYNLALVYLLTPPGNLEAAQQHARLALERNADMAPSHFLLAYLCQAGGNAEEATFHYRESLRLDPHWPKILNEEANWLVTKGAPSPLTIALALLYTGQVCQATEERRGDYLETRAAALALAGRYDEAVQTLRTALALPPDTANAALRRRWEQMLQHYEEGRR